MNITLDVDTLVALMTYVPENIIQNEINELYDRDKEDEIVYFFLNVYNQLIIISGNDEDLSILVAAKFLIYYYEYEYEVLIEDIKTFNDMYDKEYDIPFDNEDIDIMQKIIKKARELTI